MKDVDKGYRKLVKMIAESGQGEISVGIQAAEGDEEAKNNPGKTILDIATYNEFGLGVPERSFIRAWFDSHAAQNNRAIAAILKQVYKGKISLEQGLERLGLFFVGSMQKRISDGIEPPNAASTIKRKGSSKPLIDTGQLRSSITYQIQALPADSVWTKVKKWL